MLDLLALVVELEHAQRVTSCAIRPIAAMFDLHLSKPVLSDDRPLGPALHRRGPNLPSAMGWVIALASYFVLDTQLHVRQV
jgi:hypothetical protein